MIDPNERVGDEAEDPTSVRALQQALHVAPSAPVRLSQMRQSVQAEWQLAHAALAQRRHWHWAGVCAAAILITAVAGWWPSLRDVDHELVGVVRSAPGDGLLVERRWGSVQPLENGADVKSGLQLEVRATSLIALTGGGLVALKAGSQVNTLSAHELELVRGAVYVDVDSEATPGAISIRTRFGVVRHLGTQFAVAVDNKNQRVQVREGVVRSGGSVEATVHGGEEIIIGNRGEVTTRVIAADDPAWAWADDVSYDFDMEGQTVAGFLDRIARRTGRRVDYADERVRQLANTTVLHGSVHRLSALAAMRVALTTTSLSAELRGNEIRIATTAISLPVRNP